MQSTIERGDSFRDAVVALLEAADIRCVAEVRSEFKKVDIVARTESDIDGSLTVLIEAKDYRGALPKDKCVEFVVEYGTLVNGRHDHRALT
jgi:hypothetical protein